MLYHDNNLQSHNLSLDSVWILWGEVTCKSLLGVNGLKFLFGNKGDSACFDM